MNSREKGSYNAWDKIWGSEASKGLLNTYFTYNEPKTIIQFWQKIYAYDLTSLIESKSYSSFCELGSGRGTTTMYLASNGYQHFTMIDLADRGSEIAKYSFNHYNYRHCGLVQTANQLGTDSATVLQQSRISQAPPPPPLQSSPKQEMLRYDS